MIEDFIFRPDAWMPRFYLYVSSYSSSNNVVRISRSNVCMHVVVIARYWNGRLVRRGGWSQRLRAMQAYRRLCSGRDVVCTLSQKHGINIRSVLLIGDIFDACSGVVCAFFHLKNRHMQARVSSIDQCNAIVQLKLQLFDLLWVFLEFAVQLVVRQIEQVEFELKTRCDELVTCDVYWTVKLYGAHK
jgi:hypothetical protein